MQFIGSLTRQGSLEQKKNMNKWEKTEECENETMNDDDEQKNVTILMSDLQFVLDFI